MVIGTNITTANGCLPHRLTQRYSYVYMSCNIDVATSLVVLNFINGDFLVILKLIGMILAT